MAWSTIRTRLWSRLTTLDRWVFALAIAACLAAPFAKAAILWADPYLASLCAFEAYEPVDAWGRAWGFHEGSLCGEVWSKGLDGIDQGGNAGDDFVVGSGCGQIVVALRLDRAAAFVALTTLLAVLTYAAARQLRPRRTPARELAQCAALVLPATVIVTALGTRWGMGYLLPDTLLGPSPSWPTFRIAGTLLLATTTAVFAMRVESAKAGPQRG